MLSAFLESVGLKVLTTKNAFRLINFNVQTGTGRIINCLVLRNRFLKLSVVHFGVISMRITFE